MDFFRGMVIAMTGDDGVQMKVFTMHAFALEHDYETMGEHPILPNLVMMPATKAADCGVSSNYCRRSYRSGIAPSLYSIVQEMGRVDRKPVENWVSGDINKYEVHISFPCVVKLYARIMQHPDKKERNMQEQSMMEVLKLLVLPSECQHVILENYFEHPDGRQREACRNKCRKCSGIKELTGMIYRQKLTSCLVSFCSRGTMETPTTLVKFVKDNKDTIFHKNNVPRRSIGPIHALCLQLVASGIIHLCISESNRNKIGKTDIGLHSVVVGLGKTNGEPNVMIDKYWEQLSVLTNN